MEKTTTMTTRIPGSPASRWESIAIGVHLLWVVMLIAEYYSRGPALDPPRCGAPYQVKWEPTTPITPILAGPFRLTPSGVRVRALLP
jgi:hypothetical protein